MKHLHPRAIWLFFLRSFISEILILLYLFFDAIITMSFFTPFRILVIVIILAGFTYIWAKLCYRFYKYALTENGVQKESGVIRKKYVTIPYDRIQNIDIRRGILSRFLGLSDLKIQTAGNSSGKAKSEGRLMGLLQKDAEKLRDEIFAKSR